MSYGELHIGKVVKRKKKSDFYIDDRYYCSACGSHSHRCDTQYGLCYECGADAWEPEPDKFGEVI